MINTSHKRSPTWYHRDHKAVVYVKNLSLLLNGPLLYQLHKQLLLKILSETLLPLGKRASTLGSQFLSRENSEASRELALCSPCKALDSHGGHQWLVWLKGLDFELPWCPKCAYWFQPCEFNHGPRSLYSNTNTSWRVRFLATNIWMGMTYYTTSTDWKRGRLNGA